VTFGVKHATIMLHDDGDDDDDDNNKNVIKKEAEKILK
jgi:hypothetical protein